MLMLKITLCLLVVLGILTYVVNVMRRSLDWVDRLIGAYPLHLKIVSIAWVIVAIGFVGCLIATIVLW